MIEKKKKKKMLYNFQEMQAHAHLNLYNVKHSESILSLNDIGVYMYEYG